MRQFVAQARHAVDARIAAAHHGNVLAIGCHFKRGTAAIDFLGHGRGEYGGVRCHLLRQVNVNVVSAQYFRVAQRGNGFLRHECFIAWSQAYNGELAFLRARLEKRLVDIGSGSLFERCGAHGFFFIERGGHGVCHGAQSTHCAGLFGHLRHELSYSFQARAFCVFDTNLA